MHELILFVFFLSVINAPMVGPEVIPTKQQFVTPPSMVAAEFSTQAACEAAAAKTIAEIKRVAAPLIVTASYTCNKKA